jgi:hypothetical protein
MSGYGQSVVPPTRDHTVYSFISGAIRNSASVRGICKVLLSRPRRLGHPPTFCPATELVVLTKPYGRVRIPCICLDMGSNKR